MLVRRRAPIVLFSAGAVFSLVIGSAAVAVASTATQAPASVSTVTPVASGRVTVIYDRTATAADRQALTERTGAVPLSVLPATATETISVPAGVSPSDFAASLRDRPGVRFALPSLPIHKTDAPDWLDGADNRLWNLRNDAQRIPDLTGVPVAGVANADVDAPDAWTRFATEGKRSTIVAIIDSGVDISHPDLAPAVWTNPKPTLTGHDGSHDVHGWDFCHDDGSVYDPKELDPDVSDGSLNDLHGTHVAGIIAAADDHKGVVGVAPGVTVMPLKVFGTGNDGVVCSAAGIWDALIYAAQHGVTVVNASWTLEATDSRDRAEIDGLFQALGDEYGMVVVAAAGNGAVVDGTASGVDLDTHPDEAYPASSRADNVITVGAIDNRGRLASFSNYGRSSVDVLAPGVSIWSTVPQAVNGGSYDNAYGYLDGTSMAAPHVTGVAALVLSMHPMSAARVVTRLRLATKRENSGRRTAAGIISAARIENPASAIESAPLADPVVDGTATSVVGSLFDVTTGAPLVGQRLRACLRATTSRAYSCAPAVRTDAKGRATWSGRLTRPTVLQWVFAGAPNVPAVTGGGVSLHVSRAVSLRTDVSRVERGQTVHLSGTVRPAGRGLQVIVQRAVRGVWHPVGVTTTSSRGAFSFRLRFSAAGNLLIRVVVPADSRHVASGSAPRSVRVS